MTMFAHFLFAKFAFKALLVLTSFVGLALLFAGQSPLLERERGIDKIEQSVLTDFFFRYRGDSDSRAILL